MYRRDNSDLLANSKYGPSNPQLLLQVVLESLFASSQVLFFFDVCYTLHKRNIPINPLSGEYICKRSSRGEDDEEGGTSVLSAFADSFDYAGLRIEQALRLYLETFRLPGEAPLIFLVMERFAERWHVGVSPL